MNNKKGFTVLELMVGIIVFTLGFLGAYLLVESASSASIRSRDEIIGANIMREQIELVKNLRDTNWIQFRFWDSIEIAKPYTDPENRLKADTYYTIANDFNTGKTLQIKKLENFTDDKNTITSRFNNTPSEIRLCIDGLNRYTHTCTGSNEKTNYASFLRIEPLVSKNTTTNTAITVDRAYKITVFFISFNKGYRITSMNTIITDWKNQ